MTATHGAALTEGGSFIISKNLRLQPESTFEGKAYTKAVRQDGFSNNLKYVCANVPSKHYHIATTR
jgi:hypothetical protein